MKRNAIFTPPVLFVSISFVAGLTNFVDTSVRLLYSYMFHTAYPLGVYLKPVIFFIQAFSLLLLLRHGMRMSQKRISDEKLFSFLAVQLILAVVSLLLYVDFLFAAFAKMISARAYLELAFYFNYLAALAGTSFWFAWRLFRHEPWKRLSVIFVMIGLTFSMIFLERMFFWSQNYLNLSFDGNIATISMYAPLGFMFLAAVSTVFFFVFRDSTRNTSLFNRLLSLLLVPAFIIPFFWRTYKDSLLNFILLALFDWGLGYIGYEWYSVSLYLMIIVSYFLVLRWLSQRLTPSVGSALILMGVASFPLNGLTLLFLSYSSIPGNMVSLNSIVLGSSILKSKGRNPAVA